MIPMMVRSNRKMKTSRPISRPATNAGDCSTHSTNPGEKHFQLLGGYMYEYTSIYAMPEVIKYETDS